MLDGVEVDAFEPLLYDRVVLLGIDAPQSGKKIKMLLRREVWIEIIILLAHSNQTTYSIRVILDRMAKDCNIAGRWGNFASQNIDQRRFTSAWSIWKNAECK